VIRVKVRRAAGAEDAAHCALDRKVINELRFENEIRTEAVMPVEDDAMR